MSTQSIRVLLLTLLDLLICIMSYILAFAFRFDFLIQPNMIYLDAILKALPVILLIHVIVYILLGVFRSLWKYVSIEEALLLMTATIIANIVAFILLRLANYPMIPRSIYIMATMMISSGTVGVRLVYRYIRLRSKKATRTSNSFIIGAGDAGYILLREINTNNKYKTKVVGFIDDNKTKIGRIINGVPIVGGCKNLEKLVASNKVETIYVAIPSATRSEMRTILGYCQRTKANIKIMSIKEVKYLQEPHLRDISIEDLLGRGEVNLDNKEINNYIKGRVVMITGAAGSIGSELCRQIMLFNPEKLICVDVNENGLYELQHEVIIKKRHGIINENIEHISLIGSVRDSLRISKIMEKYKPFVVFHAAAHKHVPLIEDSPREAIKNNVFGTLNVVQACIKNKVDKMVLISTDKAVNPTNVMGATKRMCELIIQAYRNNGVTKLGAVRFGNVLGSNGSVIPLFKKQIESGGPVTVTDLEISRYFMTIPEASQLVLQAGVYANRGDIFVLDMGEPVKIVKLAEDLIRLSGLEPYEDIQIECIGLRPGEKMYEELSLGNEERHKTKNNLIYINEPMNIQLDIVQEKIEKLKDLISTKHTNDEIKDSILEIID